MASFSGYQSNASTSIAPAPPPPSQAAHDSDSRQDYDGGKKRKTTKRRKVTSACLYCRRSHMTCDDGRPCQRCIKREIGHLCHDEQRTRSVDKQATGTPTPTVTPNTLERARPSFSAPQPAYAPPAWPSTFVYQPETLGNEFSVLTEFLETLDEGSFFTPPPQATQVGNLVGNPVNSYTSHASTLGLSDPQAVSMASTSSNQQPESQPQQQPAPPPEQTPIQAPDPEPEVPILPAATKTERFLLTAADQESGSRDERLNRVIRSKYEAGLLKPYNYVKGYARLSRWMDRNVSQESKQQILQPLSVLRPKFRAVAQSLRDIDLVFIEEAFERLLLDYDRVFSAMGIPACLWRRTGEIYKGNREFTELVGVDGYLMRDGRLCIYELMAEESAVNYWEKYGNVAFDSSQKAVLTTCVLRRKPNLSPGSLAAGTVAKKDDGAEEGFISCCFSFTIRRDKWGIPTMIVGNFIRC
ncbi:hypothetical protein BDV98DRAFT_558309 [Pterulicium gracile]|uniref:Zn(2)-C6 fungal-type domain-containing protein n=1 Tax=Pterulicium gracile TaxID=1884261 RepID=A0A5C3R4E1_9AGAR|nr:hypothetical protein BDV98DRAFT_558309 [Pterula gracilis]